jgi:hypothetical protein
MIFFSMKRKMSFFDTHPKPELLLKVNKLHLRHIIKKIKELDTEFVKSPKYKYFCGHTNILFKLIQRMDPSFIWKKTHIRIFLISFIMEQDTDAYHINEQSGFYQSLKNHVRAFDEYLNSDSQPQQWLPFWGQLLIDFNGWKEKENKKLNYEPVESETPEFGNLENTTPPPHRQYANRRNINIPQIHTSIINKAMTITKCVHWDKIVEDITQNIIQNWKYTWTLLEDIVLLFSEINGSRDMVDQIQRNLDADVWKQYIINHENKEHAFKEYFNAVREIFELVGIPDHKDRYLSLNQECNEIISVQSFEYAIPYIFQKIFKECEVLCSSLGEV